MILYLNFRKYKLSLGDIIINQKITIISTKKGYYLIWIHYNTKLADTFDFATFTGVRVNIWCLKFMKNVIENRF